MAKKLISTILVGFSLFAFTWSASAYQVVSSRELGRDDAKNQNVVVKCTTDTGKISNQQCILRRYAKCSESASGGAKRCSGWQPWKNIRDPKAGDFSDWKSAAGACCRAMGLR